MLLNTELHENVIHLKAKTNILSLFHLFLFPALPSNRVNKRIHCVLDLCAPPLKPLILQPMDKASITKWCQNFWSIASNGENIK